MKSDNINNFYKGWFIGHFKDAMLDSLNFEAGVKYFKSGESNPPHFHKRHKEINFVFSGKVSFNDIVFLPGSIVIVEEGECSNFICIEDCCVLVLRDGSDPSDKYEC